MSSLRDQVALVTGSSRGIGAAIAKSFAQQGAKVVVHGRDGAALSSIRKEIELAGGRSMQVGGDVTNFTDVEAARSITNTAGKGWRRERRTAQKAHRLDSVFPGMTDDCSPCAASSNCRFRGTRWHAAPNATTDSVGQPESRRAELWEELVGSVVSTTVSLLKILYSPWGMSLPQPDRKPQGVCGAAPDRRTKFAMHAGVRE
jgi:NAD(P)-dependent dehydrogenase (short-subunit alcohol dehydrogenase family)